MTQQVIDELEEVFKGDHYPSKESLQELARKYSETYARIKNWFRTQRKKMFDVGALNYEVIKFKKQLEIILSPLEKAILFQNPIPLPQGGV